MLKKTGEWAYSFNGEIYEFVFLDSKKEAIKTATEEAKERGETIFFVGQVEQFVPEIDVAENMLYGLQDQADEDFGEWSDGYLESVSNKEMDDLNKKIEAAFFAWLEKYLQHKPGFFIIRDGEEYNVNEENKK